MKAFTFTVYLTGYGDSPATAWTNALSDEDQLLIQPVPMTYVESDIEDKEHSR
jgi:hypothetical protein